MTWTGSLDAAGIPLSRLELPDGSTVEVGVCEWGYFGSYEGTDGSVCGTAEFHPGVDGVLGGGLAFG